MTVLRLSLGCHLCLIIISLVFPLLKVIVSCASPAWLTPPSAHLPTGHHRPFWKAPHTHPLQELRDDQRAQRQPGRKLRDHYDRHSLIREEEHWCMWYLSLELLVWVSVTGWRGGVQGLGGVYVWVGLTRQTSSEVSIHGALVALGSLPVL